MSTDESPDLLEGINALARAARGLRMMVLHGSRARGTAHERSDWDFAYEAEPGFDADALLAGLADLLRADRIDLVDLGTSGALLRYRAARDGVLIFESTSGLFGRFRVEAARTWFDLAPVLEPVYDQVLAEIQRP